MNAFFIVSLDGLAFIVNMDTSVEEGGLADVIEDVIEVAQPPPCLSAITIGKVTPAALLLPQAPVPSTSTSASNGNGRYSNN